VDAFGIVVAFFYFYMVVDAYKTAKAKELGLPLPDLLHLNSIFGLEGNGHATAVAPQPAPAATAPNSPPPPAAAPAQPVVPPDEAPGVAYTQSAAASYPLAAPVVPLAQTPAPPAYEPAVPAPTHASRVPGGAVVLIILGVLFLLGNLGWFHFHWIGRMWPVVLIVLGLWMFARRWGTRA
jgi:hypothetical protein